MGSENNETLIDTISLNLCDVSTANLQSSSAFFVVHAHSAKTIAPFTLAD